MKLQTIYSLLCYLHAYLIIDLSRLNFRQLWSVEKSLQIVLLPYTLNTLHSVSPHVYVYHIYLHIILHIKVMVVRNGWHSRHLGLPKFPSVFITYIFYHLVCCVKKTSYKILTLIINMSMEIAERVIWIMSKTSFFIKSLKFVYDISSLFLKHGWRFAWNRLTLLNCQTFYSNSFTPTIRIQLE